jgi:acetylornithine deacetylase/succinyl-diaminopimelate desuccinylase-like protein
MADSTRVHADEALGLARELVRAPSPNPPGHEVAVQRVARAYLDDIPGVEIEERGSSPDRPMLVATLEGRRDGPTIILGGHVDTVPVADGWTRDPFEGEISDNRLYGLGASDMKGGVAAIMVALRRLAADPPGATVVLHLVPDEEPGGQFGAEMLLDAGQIVGDAAIIAEPSELRVFCAQKGNLFAAIHLRGRAAHGSMPENGVNAISAALRLGVDLEERLAPMLRSRSHALVGPASLSIGTISGGRRTNVVPDECTLTVDRRLVPGESADEAIAELERFVGSRASVSVEHAGAAFETREDHWLVRHASSAIEAVTGRRA